MLSSSDTKINKVGESIENMGDAYGQGNQENLSENNIEYGKGLLMEISGTETIRRTEITVFDELQDLLD